MGILDRKKPCPNCGSKKIHRTCFSGGGKNWLDQSDSKTRENIRRTVELNESRGHKWDKGLSADQASWFMRHHSRRG